MQPSKKPTLFITHKKEQLSITIKHTFIMKFHLPSYIIGWATSLLVALLAVYYYPSHKCKLPEPIKIVAPIKEDGFNHILLVQGKDTTAWVGLTDRELELI